MARDEVLNGLADFARAAKLTNPKQDRLAWGKGPRPTQLWFGFNSGGTRPRPPRDNDQKIAACTERLRSDPKNVGALYERGYAHYSKHEYDKAIADYDRILRLDPEDAEAYRERAHAHFRKKAYERAIADLAAAMKLDPENADDYAWRAWVHKSKEDSDRALADCGRALRLDPQFAFAHSLMGGLHAKRGEHDRAIAEYGEALRLNPGYAACYSNRAREYHLTGEYAKALADYDELVRRNPKDAAGHALLAWHLATNPEAKLRDGPRAVDEATEACELTEWRDPDNLDTLAAAYAECGRFEQAVKWQTRALELAPAEKRDEIRSRLDLGSVLPALHGRAG